MVGRPNTAQVICTVDENTDYVRLWLLPKDGDPMVFRVSLGGAEVLASEIAGCVNRARGESVSIEGGM